MNTINKTTNTGRICEIRRDRYTVLSEDRELPAVIRGALRTNGSELPVIGDYVTYEYDPFEASVITSVCERRSILSRPDSAGRSVAHAGGLGTQVMAANFDYVFIVTSLNENYRYNRIARYVSLTLQGGGIPVVILTKKDLCPDPERYVAEVSALSDRVRVHAVSALEGIDREELGAYLQPGSTVVLLGSSGVGKSTLVNAIVGTKVMRTGAIREDDARGRHTTTHRRMLRLPNGACLIDTPGMRELGMCDTDEGIDETFSDITELAAQCRFRDCRHQTEPGCAVRHAIATGELSEARFALFTSLHTESSHAKKLLTIAKSRRMINKAR